jgi:RNA polymerase sigma-70 factor (ECF subfamily)
MTQDDCSDARFEQEALCWFDDVFRFSMALMRDREDAEDLVQETYLRAFRSWHTFQPGRSARRWLFAICYHRFVRMRERARRPFDRDAASLDSMEELVTTADSRPCDEQLLTGVDVKSVLWDAIDRLSEPYRSALILVDVDQQSYESASMILDVPIGTVRSRLFRARRLLRPVLAPYARDIGFSRAAITDAPHTSR